MITRETKTGPSADDWVMLKDAPERLKRPKSMIYKWVQSGQVQTIRPLHERWCLLEDLLRLDAATPRRRRT
ncbi:hypothetical protein ACFSWE_09470 [Leucobacter albus]|uniref:Uncharacterized protein n=1 Tax=Leucobacter albus TaxID=272210 RepID=A0ABW3TS57_9MICO